MIPLLFAACTVEVTLREPELGDADAGLEHRFGLEPPELVWCDRRVDDDTGLAAHLLDHGPGWATYEPDWPDASYWFDCDPVDLEDVGASLCDTNLHGIDGPFSVLCLEETAP